MASHLCLKIQPDRQVEVSNFLGGHPVADNGSGLELKFGSLLFGQSKDFVIELSSNAFSSLSVSLSYTSVNSGNDLSKTLVFDSYSQTDDKKAFERHLLRLKSTEMIEAALAEGKANRMKDAASLVVDMSKTIKASSVVKEPLIKDLLKDVDGQITEALSREEFYSKWGKHYLPSLQGAHLNQQCNNFKDPGVQHYGGKLFKKIRDDVDATFLQLPPPKPSLSSAPVPQARAASSVSGSSSGGSRPQAAPAFSMSHYNRSSNPCFAGSSLVLMSDGSLRAVEQMQKGDVVALPKGSSATVRCVVRTRCNNGATLLVEFPGGLLVTPYHPVRVDGKWAFPCDLAEARVRPCEAVYSFLLEDNVLEKVMIINGVECVAFAHGLTESKVVEHAYFGTKRVVADLQRMAGWDKGLIELVEGCLVRDEMTNLVVGLSQLCS